MGLATLSLRMRKECIKNGGSKPPPYVVLIFFSAFIFIVFVIAFGDGERTLFTLSPSVGVGAKRLRSKLSLLAIADDP